MKRTIMTIILACVAMLMTQCRKNEVLNPANGVSDELIDVTLNVDNGAKTVIDPNGIVTWKAGDKIHIVGETSGYLGYVKTEAGGDPATFTGKINGITTRQTLRFYYIGSNEFVIDGNNDFTFSIATGQNGTLETIADKFHLAYGVSEYPVQPGTTDLGKISMTSKIAIADFNITRKDDCPFGLKMKLNGCFTTMKFNVKTGAFETPTGLGVIEIPRKDGHYYVALLPGKQTIEFSHYVVGKTLEQKEIKENRMYTLDVELENINTVPIGALAGTFKIAADKSVYFAKGNLYKTADGEWGFENRQDDYRTWSGYSKRTGGTVTSTANGEFGLFGWSGNECTVPYGADATLNNANYQGEFEDWGGISTLPGGADVWYTMKMSNWTYLISEREDYLARRKFWIGNDGPFGNGVLLLPEEIAAGECAEVMNDIITSSINKIASYGALFLPFYGRRDWEGYTNPQYGYYWTSEKDGDDHAICPILGYYEEPNPDYPTVIPPFPYIYRPDRFFGCGIRLVQNISND